MSADGVGSSVGGSAKRRKVMALNVSIDRVREERKGEQNVLKDQEVARWSSTTTNLTRVRRKYLVDAPTSPEAKS